MAGPISRPPSRRPGLARCGRLALRTELAHELRVWMRAHGVGLRTLAASLGCSLRRAHDFYTGSAPIPVELISALDHIHAASLQAALDAVIKRSA